MEWVARITTIGLEMSLPAIGGHYLDQRWGTQYWALIGLVVGVTVGLWHLVQMTRPAKGRIGAGGDRAGGNKTSGDRDKR